ncbi:MAG: SAM-dependent methyltransferase [Candidatus Protochlamydia sp.]|nr:SAM-dependent methyltransferase [Candidatus Protochlamydia sp.]
MNKDELENLLTSLFENKLLISAVLSSPLFPGVSDKITLRSLVMNGQANFQSTTIVQKQAFHKNYKPSEALVLLKQNLFNYKQTMLFTRTADYQILINKKQHATLLKKTASKAATPLTHNRTKEYILPEGIPVPFLVKLGVMSPAGKVNAQKGDKFRQINRFLEMVEDVLPHFQQKSTLQIVDFGCGKAYLTFALFHFLKEVKGYTVNMKGIDLKEAVIQECSRLSKDLGYAEELEFILGDINAFDIDRSVDLVVSLHACDTATDAALEKAIKWQARVILSVPCCQHELFKQVRHDGLAPLLKHGIIKERFAALATDAARGQLLEALGYQVQILEFIDVEHTPKNLLIRAIIGSNKKDCSKALEEYRVFKSLLNIHPSLEKRFQENLNQ